MSATGGSPPTLVLDANVIIDLISLEAFDTVLRLPGYELAVLPEVIGEVSRPVQAIVLSAALESGLIGCVALESDDELADFARLDAVVGRGEAASLAYAASHGCHFATDEMRGKLAREVRLRLGADRLVRGPELLVGAVSAGLTGFDALHSRVDELTASAATARERDEAEHLARVLQRVRKRMGLGELA